MEPSLFPEIDGDHPLRLHTQVEPPVVAVPGRPLVAAWGMGVNSTAMLIGMEQCGIRPDLILAADTGGEKPETYAYIKEFERWLVEVDFPRLIIVRNDGIHGTLEQECLTNQVLPSRVYGYSGCSEKYKIRPQNKLISQWPDAVATWRAGEKVWRAIGYDAGESHRATVQEDRRYCYWYPLIQWGWARAECIEAIHRAGLPVPPKSACFFCPSMAKREVLALHRDHPELFARVVAMERNAADYNQNVKGLGRRWSWEGLVSLPLLEQAGLAEPPEMPCACFDGSCEEDEACDA